MTIVITPRVQNAIDEHLRSEYPREGCGLLVGGEDESIRWVDHPAPLPNSDPDPRRRYTISPEDFLAHDKAAREHGLEIVGFYHSHPDGPSTPSASDTAEAWSHYTYLIVGVGPDRAEAPTAWRLVDGSFVAERIRRKVRRPRTDALMADWFMEQSQR